MGTIIALGGGRFDNGEMTGVAAYIRDASGKAHPHVLFLPTAGFDDMDGDEPIRDTFLSLGCTFTPLLLTDPALTRDDVRSAILGTDIIYAGGGNLQFLLDTWDRTGASDALREAFARGVVLSGFSSGAMCWFEGGYDDCGTDHTFMFLPCLGLLPHYYCPHFTSEVWQRFGERIAETGCSGIGVEDGAALIYRNGAYDVITGNEDGDVFFFDKAQNYRRIRITDNADILSGVPPLSVWDGEPVRIVDVDGNIFEGECAYLPSGYGEAELGRDEEALQIDDWVFFRSDVRSVTPCPDKETYIWMSRPEHRLSVSPDVFLQISDGQTDVPLCLPDALRGAVQTGDILRLENDGDDTDVLHAQVLDVNDGRVRYTIL